MKILLKITILKNPDSKNSKTKKHELQILKVTSYMPLPYYARSGFKIQKHMAYLKLCFWDCNNEYWILKDRCNGGLFCV